MDGRLQTIHGSSERTELLGVHLDQNQILVFLLVVRNPEVRARALIVLENLFCYVYELRQILFG